MSVTTDDSVKWWTVKGETALAVEIILDKTTVAQASRAYYQ
jgi:hypothetical protein